MKVRFASHWHQVELEPEDIELEVSCPSCKIGQKWCSDCHNKGYVVTMIGERILEFVARNLKDYLEGKLNLVNRFTLISPNVESDRRQSDEHRKYLLNRMYGKKSSMDQTAAIPEIEAPKAQATNKSQVKGDGSKAPTLPRPATQLPPRTSNVRSVPGHKSNGHPPQKRSWEIP